MAKLDPFAKNKSKQVPSAPLAAQLARSGGAPGFAGRLPALRTAAAEVAAKSGRRWASVAAAAAAQRPAVAYTAAALSEGLSPGSRRALGWWLGGCSAWVAALIVLGGVTRLTRSGLSMTTWKFTGERVPRTRAEWEAEFELYRRSPEWARVNRSMTLEEFKFIYFMEYAHRTVGRALGAVFALPALGFALAGRVNRALARRLLLLFTMGGTQGLVGWWMVRSGLDDPADPHAVPRVSPYRLASHLVSAFAIFATLAWTTLDLARPAPAASTPTRPCP